MYVQCTSTGMTKVRARGSAPTDWRRGVSCRVVCVGRRRLFSCVGTVAERIHPLPQDGKHVLDLLRPPHQCQFHTGGHKQQRFWCWCSYMKIQRRA